jgi:hypothetical protein
MKKFFTFILGGLLIFWGARLLYRAIMGKEQQ